MIFKIYEYNVTPNVNQKDVVSIYLENDKMNMNGQNIEDVNKINSIKKILEDNKERIIAAASQRQYNSKGGRQKMITVKFDENGESYGIIGNGSSKENNDFYTKIVNDVIKIIKGE